MEQFTAIRRVKLGDHHLSPGRANDMIVGSNGKRPFAPFKELIIAHDPGTVGCYLMHHSIDGRAADTWHESLEDALHQAEWEFEVELSEWVEINEFTGEAGDCCNSKVWYFPLHPGPNLPTTLTPRSATYRLA